MGAMVGCDRCGPWVDAGRAGTVALAAGAALVAAPAVTQASVIFLTPQPGVVPLAACWVSAVTPGTGFTISSLNVLDKPTVAWLILEPGGG